MAGVPSQYTQYISGEIAFMQNATIEKLCPACGLSRPLGDFFSAGYNSRAAETRTGRYCKACHSAGDIKHGYGWSGYSEQFATPESTAA